MATKIIMQNPQTGEMKVGLYGYSWTTLFFGAFPALFRGDILVFFIVFILNVPTFGLTSLIWSFMYNNRYTKGLLARGFVFVGSEGENQLAMANLGVAPANNMQFISPAFQPAQPAPLVTQIQDQPSQVNQVESTN